MEGPTFEAIVRGHKAMETGPDLEAGCLRKLKAARRQADGLRVDRAVACITDRWQAIEVGTDWVDDWVCVGVDAGGRATFERIDREESY